MDAGGWMDIHTVCHILHTRYDYEGISVNRLVALIRSTQGERYEIAICKLDHDDQNALAALDDHTDTRHVDPLRSHPRTRLDPRRSLHQFERAGPRAVVIMWAFAPYTAIRRRV